MDTVFRAIRKLLPRLPYLSLAIALLYMAGRQYNVSYWKGMGLPLMIASQPVADTVADGFYAWALLVFSWFPLAVDPLWLVICGPLICAGMFFFGETLTKRVERRRANGHRFPRRTKAPPIVQAAGGALIRIFEIFPGFAIPPILAIVTFIGGLLIVISPMKSIDVIARKQSAAEAATYRHKLENISDGAAEVSVVRYQGGGDEKNALGIPMTCNTDRCSIMTSSGPVSLPKDKIVEEYLQAARSTSARTSKAEPVRGPL
ncbi:hypothetical protein [Luteibacter aegosomatissinici]|uniref:hypothetical protein n=1 Tax=Luteibacter aegosomatissinici TaxID=2911539 RepID=UPI001FFAA750|nr:hypothetical protein [Luteibacter aegosomatissinici]UPG93887.1 hypothetical protein L2Y97_18935 [Luteibacter aegosomatissinici]